VAVVALASGRPARLSAGRTAPTEPAMRNGVPGATAVSSYAALAPIDRCARSLEEQSAPPAGGRLQLGVAWEHPQETIVRSKALKWSCRIEARIAERRAPKLINHQPNPLLRRA
jgi:hypothetical protein